ncbi:MAG: multi-sensor signal transduction histidine kinase [Sphingobacteriaceae bacterium]|jgi:PAS domain S-box-containing protein|nr:multi-sensor signal transduction histidine kinase [Sphingobacteriaceae bacterium]
MYSENPDTEALRLELARTKNELHTLSKRFSLATQSVRLGIWEYVLDDNRILLDENTTEMYGLEKGSSYSLEDLTQLVYPEDRAQVGASVESAIQTGEGFRGSLRILKPDGEIRYIRVGGMVEKDESGRAVRLVGANQDITSKVRAEQAIKDSEAKYKSFFENSMDAILIGRVDGTIISANPAACEIFRKTEAEIIEAGRDNLVDNSDGKLTKLIEKRDSTGRAKGEITLVRHDGSKFTAEISLALFSDTSGEKLLHILLRDITERLNSEQQLRESEAKYRSFFENSMDATLLTIRDGRVLAANPAACEMFEMNEEEICRVGRDGLVDTSDPALPKLVEERLRKGKAKGELTFKRKNGSTFPAEVSSSVFESNGEYMTIMIIRDFSERKNAEAELKHSNERYEIVSKATNDAVWDWNLKTNELWWGENFFTLFGYNKDETPSSIDSWYAGIHPKDKDPVMGDIARAISKREHSWAGEYRFYKANGEFLYVYDRGYLEYDENGIPHRMIGSMSDITARKTAEESLKHSEEGYRQIVETAQEGIWLIDQENVTIFVNRKMCDILGYSQSEMMGCKSYEFMAEEWRKVDEEQTAKRTKGRNENYEFQFLSKSGTGVWVSISTNSVYNEDGSYRGALAMVTDISQKKEQEIELQKTTEEREMLISELVKSNYDLQQFSYITSHNFRAPMANLIALLNLIDEGSLDDENRNIIDMFRSSTNQLNTTINDLVEILIVKSSTNLLMSENDIEAVYEEIYSTLLFQIVETGAVINRDFKVRNIYFHTTYLKSILMNLLTNAIRYRSPSRQLEISIRTEEDVNGNILLTVADNGLGIDLKRHGNSLFGLYQKFHSNPESVGLGLYIVKSQITALGGSISVDSEVDKGSTFSITFKAHK